MEERTPYPRMAIAVLALIGLFDSLYLAFERASGGNILCPTGGGCETVAASPYSMLFGALPVAYVGVAGYGVLFALALLALYRDQAASVALPLLMLATSTVGAIFSAYLVYLQIAVIQAICFWCMTSALTQALIWAAALIDWRFYEARERAPARTAAPPSQPETTP